MIEAERELGAEREFGPFGRLLFRACKILALAGGLLLVAVVAMSLVSIIGRKIFSMPVPGDMEMLQMAAAVALSAFFAFCHMNGGDVKVDFFTQNASQRWVRRLDGIGCGLVGLVGGLLAWRIVAGARGLMADGETSVILGWPVGWAQLLMAPGFILLALAGFYMSAHHWRFSVKAKEL